MTTRYSRSIGKNPPEFGYNHGEYLRDVVAALQTKKAALVDGLEGRKSLELITALYESIETNTRRSSFASGPGSAGWEWRHEHLQRIYENVMLGEGTSWRTSASSALLLEASATESWPPRSATER